MPYLTYNDSRVFYEITGAGRPLLYLHGWNGSMRSFKDCLSQELEKAYQLIMLDLPGFGRSTYIPLSFAAISEIIERILTRHNIEKVMIMGFCMGGAFALDFTIRHPDRVQSLVLVETSFEFPWVMSPILLPVIGKQILRFFLFNPIGIHLTKQHLLLSDHQYREGFYAQFQNVDLNISHAYTRLLFAYSKVGHQQRINRIQANTKIIIGKHTSTSIRSSAKRLGKLIENSEIIFLEHSRHFPIEENSAGLLRSLRFNEYLKSTSGISQLESQLVSP